MRTLFALPCALIACATPEPIATPTPSSGPTRLEAVPRPAPPFDAKGFAADQLTPAGVRKVRAAALRDRPDQGWAALVACVERSRWPRGEFTHSSCSRAALGPGAADASGGAAPDRQGGRAPRRGRGRGHSPGAEEAAFRCSPWPPRSGNPTCTRAVWILVRGALSEIRQDGTRPPRSCARLPCAPQPARWRTGHLALRELLQGKRTRGVLELDAQQQRGPHRLQRSRAAANTAPSGRSEYSSVKQKFENERVETGRRAVGKTPSGGPVPRAGKGLPLPRAFRRGESGAGPAPGRDAVDRGYFQPNALLIQ